ncbi:hypothetical protein E2C01_000418 [Portunus trituberculatus]|uniref:Uncharacterized protein n=1 Tax=Portunus trituberculatus TaxID=210409 RepID=A0A5B7CGE2_PORTR|nr:hypothetical protein [Portunus trituberculatus]
MRTFSKWRRDGDIGGKGQGQHLKGSSKPGNTHATRATQHLHTPPQRTTSGNMDPTTQQQGHT